jgi:flagellar motor component MotA
MYEEASCHIRDATMKIQSFASVGDSRVSMGPLGAVMGLSLPIKAH